MASNSWLFLFFFLCSWKGNKWFSCYLSTYGTNKWLGSWKEATVMCLIKIDIEAEQSIEEVYKSDSNYTSEYSSEGVTVWNSMIFPFFKSLVGLNIKLLAIRAGVVRFSEVLNTCSYFLRLFIRVWPKSRKYFKAPMKRIGSVTQSQTRSKFLVSESQSQTLPSF